MSFCCTPCTPPAPLILLLSSSAVLNCDVSNPIMMMHPPYAKHLHDKLHLFSDPTLYKALPSAFKMLHCPAISPRQYLLLPAVHGSPCRPPSRTCEKASIRIPSGQCLPLIPTSQLMKCSTFWTHCGLSALAHRLGPLAACKQQQCNVICTLQ